jgi:hypothetical protein
MFSFGVIAYELLTGRLPLSEPAVEFRRRNEPLPIPPLGAQVGALRPRLAALFSDCPSAEALLSVLLAGSVSTGELETMLSALGDQKARSLIAAAKARLEIGAGDLDPAQALQILDDLAGQPGLVGVTARFARARAAARFSQPASSSEKPAT